MRDLGFPDQGLNPHSLQWKHGVFAAGPPRKSLLQTSHFQETTPNTAHSCIKMSYRTGGVEHHPEVPRFCRDFSAGSTCNTEVICRVIASTYSYIWGASCRTSSPNLFQVRSHEHLLWRAVCRVPANNATCVGAEAGAVDSFWSPMMVSSSTGYLVYQLSHGCCQDPDYTWSHQGQVQGSNRTLLRIWQMCAGERKAQQYCLSAYKYSVNSCDGSFAINAIV